MGDKKAMRRAAVFEMEQLGFYWIEGLGWRKLPSGPYDGVRVPAGANFGIPFKADLGKHGNGLPFVIREESERQDRQRQEREALADMAPDSAEQLRAVHETETQADRDGDAVKSLQMTLREGSEQARKAVQAFADAVLRAGRDFEARASIKGDTKPAESRMERRARLFDELEDMLEPDRATFVIPKPMMARLMDRFAKEHSSEMVVDHEMRACSFLDEVLADAISRIESRINGDAPSAACSTEAEQPEEDVAEAQRLLRCGGANRETQERNYSDLRAAQEFLLEAHDHVVSVVPRAQLVSVLQMMAFHQAGALHPAAITTDEALAQARRRADEMEANGKAFTVRQRVNVLDAESIQAGHVPVPEFRGNVTVAKGWLCETLNALMNARGEEISPIAAKRQRIVQMIEAGVAAGMEATPTQEYPS